MKTHDRMMISVSAVWAMAAGMTVCAADTKLPLPPALKGVSRLAFLGDSITDGSDYPDYVVNTLNKTYPGHHFSFINAGVCGNRSNDLVDRLDRDVLSQKPDLTFIFIGTNDRGGNPLSQYKADLIYLSRRL